MPFTSPTYNAPTTIEEFQKDGCQSKNNKTEKICGSTQGYTLVSGPDFTAFTCSKCGITNIVYKDQETKERCMKNNIGVIQGGGLSMSIDLPVEKKEDNKEEMCPTHKVKLVHTGSYLDHVVRECPTKGCSYYLD